MDDGRVRVNRSVQAFAEEHPIRLRIEHTTVYEYDTPVLSSYNEARLIPQTEERQLTLESTIRTDPPASQQRYWDYWGTQVASFDLHQKHDRLTVVGRSVVETAPYPARPAADLTWNEIDDERFRDQFVETLTCTRMTAPVPELSDAAQSLREGRSPEQYAADVIAYVGQTLRYRAGSTGVQTTAAEAWTAGVGVCQDLAHLALLLLRCAGIPARYVSGYLHPRPEAAIGEVVHGESHAWVEAWLGRWVPADPTNGVPVGAEHVVVARGRDYGDVPPLRGLYSGSAGSSLEVSVSVQRLR
jgi:transglutaminase-like putative cysteine protease